jgi:hypothetical protein
MVVGLGGVAVGSLMNGTEQARLMAINIKNKIGNGRHRWGDEWDLLLGLGTFSLL